MTHLSEWPKSRKLTIPNASEGVEQQELSSTVGGNVNGTATLEDCFMVSYKTKHALTIWSSNHAPWYLPKWVENLCPHKNLHTDVYSSFIHNCQKLEATKMSFSKWMDKQTVVHPDSAFSTVLKRNKLSSHEKTWRKQKSYYYVKESSLNKLHIVWF